MQCLIPSCTVLHRVSLLRELTVALFAELVGLLVTEVAYCIPSRHAIAYALGLLILFCLVTVASKADLLFALIKGSPPFLLWLPRYEVPACPAVCLPLHCLVSPAATTDWDRTSCANTDGYRLKVRTHTTTINTQLPSRARLCG